MLFAAEEEAAASCYSAARPSHCSLVEPNKKQPAALENDQNQACTAVESRKLKGIYKHYKVKEFENTVCSVCSNRRPEIANHKDFTYAELDEATDSFSRRNFLSEGGFGLVFRGKLKDGLKVAVKQLKAASLQGEKEFKSEVYVLSQARHKNLVMLLGSCAEGTQRLLVYEYICNGSLEDSLSGTRFIFLFFFHFSLYICVYVYNMFSTADVSQTLSWEQRMKIARGAAEGLAYLHDNNIVHRDVRPGNILITHDYEALVGSQFNALLIT